MKPMEPIVLKSIAEEAEDCRKAFQLSEIGDLVNFCHHGRIIEALTEPAEVRITYILDNKPFYEQAARLRMFRPVKGLQFIDWRDRDVMLSLATIFAEKTTEKQTAERERQWMIVEKLTSQLSGLYRAGKMVQDRMLKDYPFRQLFGVDWQDDIFSTFDFVRQEGE